MTWAKGRQLASVSMGDETTGATAIAYAYDMDGIRRSKTVGGVTTEFVTQSGLVARQSWSGNTIDFFYDAQQRPYAMIYKPAGGTSATYYYLTNLQGDVIALLDESGSVVAEYEYGAWGDIRSITDSSGAQITSSAHIASINPLRYRGYYYDAETGFYYLQSRYYDPVIKRFINADAAEYSALSALSLYDTNLFAYCRNNPVMNKDDDGEWVNIVVGAVVGGVVGAAMQVAMNVAMGQSWNAGILGAIAGGAVYGAIAATPLGFVAASYASAAVESLTNEVCAYTCLASANGNQRTSLNRENLSMSITNVFQDTIVNGTLTAAAGTIANARFPVPQTGADVPQKIFTRTAATYALKSTIQSVAQGCLSSSMQIVRRTVPVLLAK